MPDQPVSKDRKGQLDRPDRQARPDRQVFPESTEPSSTRWAAATWAATSSCCLVTIARWADRPAQAAESHPDALLLLAAIARFTSVRATALTRNSKACPSQSPLRPKLHSARRPHN